MDAAVYALLNRVELGSAAKQFLDKTQLGKHIMQKALEDEEAALKALQQADPEDAKLIRKLQNEANMPSFALSWFIETINEGNNATAELDARESQT